MEQSPEETENKVYYYKCGGCGSEIFHSDIKPSVERAARVFKWVRAGCPNKDCSGYLVLSAPEKIYDPEEAARIYEQKKLNSGQKVYWIPS